MEDSFKISLFAHDLMNYILRMDNRNIQLPIDKNMRKAMSDNSPLNDTIGLAVSMLKEKHMTLIAEEYKKVREFEFEVNIGRWAMQRAVSFCSEGYEPRHFLIYTSLIVGMASIYSGHERVAVVKLLTEIYALVLTSYVMTAEFHHQRGFELMTTAADALLDILEGSASDSDEATEAAATAENAETAPPTRSEATENAETDPPSKSEATKNAKKSGKRKGTGKKKGRKHK